MTIQTDNLIFSPSQDQMVAPMHTHTKNEHLPEPNFNLQYRTSSSHQAFKNTEPSIAAFAVQTETSILDQQEIANDTKENQT
jgi:hypothetical protein